MPSYFDRLKFKQAEARLNKPPRGHEYSVTGALQAGQFGRNFFGEKQHLQKWAIMALANRLAPVQPGGFFWP